MIHRWEDGKAVFDLAVRIVPTVLPVSGEVMAQARDLMNRHPEIAARDAVHASVASMYGIEEICSYDRDFNTISAIRRIELE